MYFLQQLGSGHSSNTGDGGGLLQGVLGTAGMAGGGTTTLVFFPGMLPCWAFSSSPTLLFLLFDGSGRGGTNGVGDDGAVVGADPLVAPLRPLAPGPPLRNLLCTEERVSKRR